MRHPEDDIKLAQMDKSKPLYAFGVTRAYTCVLCDGPLGGDDRTDWCVTIKSLGKAHTACAGDRGFTIR